MLETEWKFCTIRLISIKPQIKLFTFTTNKKLSQILFCVRKNNVNFYYVSFLFVHTTIVCFFDVVKASTPLLLDKSSTRCCTLFALQPDAARELVELVCALQEPSAWTGYPRASSPALSGRVRTSSRNAPYNALLSRVPRHTTNSSLNSISTFVVTIK